MAGERPSRSAVATGLTELHLRLLCDLQSIVDLDSKIPDGAFKFHVAKQELDRLEISSPSVDQRGFFQLARAWAISGA